MRKFSKKNRVVASRSHRAIASTRRHIKASAIRRKSTSNRPISASKRRISRRAVMAGAGSGITLLLKSFEFTNVPNGRFYVDDFGGLNGMHPFLEADKHICKGVIEIESIGTYYDGGDPRLGEIPVEINITDVIPDNDDEVDAIAEAGLRGVIEDFRELDDYKIRLGGGWIRSSFGGTFEAIGYAYNSEFGCTVNMQITIPDKELVTWLDAFANGDTDVVEYDVCINDDPQGNPTDNREDAIALAQEYADDPNYAEDEITVIMNHYTYGYEGDYLNEDSEVIWNSNDYLYE